MSKGLKKIASYFGIYIFAKRTKIKLYEIIHSRIIGQNRKNEMAFYSGLISQGQLCFDVGANAGDKSEIFLSLGAKVVAFEPQSKCVGKIKKRFRRSDNIRVIDKGLSDKPGVQELFVCETSDTISTMSGKWKHDSRFSKDHIWKNTVNVEVTTLDEAIKEFGQPYYIKIDVEGFELNVIKGLNKAVRLLSFEYIDEFIDDSTRCLNHLSSLGPIKVNVLQGMDKHFMFDKFLDYNDFQYQFREFHSHNGCGDIFVITDLNPDAKKD